MATELLTAIRTRAESDEERRLKVLKRDVLLLLEAAEWVLREADHPGSSCILGRESAMYRRDAICECGLDDLRMRLTTGRVKYEPGRTIR